MIPVTKPFLPPKEEYDAFVQGIWQRNWLTNHGPLVTELEQKLKSHLGMEHMLYLNNGTIALQIAIKALGLTGEIITTPFSYVATTSSIAWEGCKPVFVDIDSRTLNIDPEKIEAAITSQTTGIIATHVYGNPCDVEAIDVIAKKHKLKVIYDAAHAFGTTYKGRSIYAFGDISTASFHATKLFHTVEGGAVFTGSRELFEKMSLMRNFGHNGPESFGEVGINGKNSEFHAAMGLANMKYVSEILRSRKDQSSAYDQQLNGLHLPELFIDPQTGYNCAYYPVILKDEALTLTVIKELESNDVFPRRYFCPALNTVSLYKGQSLPVVESVARRIICLPLYTTLTFEEIERICAIIVKIHNG